MRSLIHAVLVAAILAAAGCRGFGAPALAVNDVVVTGATSEALGLGIVMELRNTNREPLELDEFRYSVSIDGTKVYTGRHYGGATLGAGATRRVTIPAVVAYERAGWLADVPASTRYSVSGQMRYTVPGQFSRLLAELGLRRPKASFSKRGELQLAPGAAGAQGD